MNDPSVNMNPQGLPRGARAITVDKELLATRLEAQGRHGEALIHRILGKGRMTPEQLPEGPYREAFLRAQRNLGDVPLVIDGTEVMDVPHHGEQWRAGRRTPGWQIEWYKGEPRVVYRLLRPKPMVGDLVPRLGAEEGVRRRRPDEVERIKLKSPEGGPIGASRRSQLKELRGVAEQGALGGMQVQSIDEMLSRLPSSQVTTVAPELNPAEISEAEQIKRILAEDLGEEVERVKVTETTRLTPRELRAYRDPKKRKRTRAHTRYLVEQQYKKQLSSPTKGSVAALGLLDVMTDGHVRFDLALVAEILKDPEAVQQMRAAQGAPTRLGAMSLEDVYRSVSPKRIREAQERMLYTMTRSWRELKQSGFAVPSGYARAILENPYSGVEAGLPEGLRRWQTEFDPDQSAKDTAARVARQGNPGDPKDSALLRRVRQQTGFWPDRNIRERVTELNPDLDLTAKLDPKKTRKPLKYQGGLPGILMGLVLPPLIAKGVQVATRDEPTT